MYCSLKALTDFVTLSLPKPEMKPVCVTIQEHTVYYALQGNTTSVHTKCVEKTLGVWPFNVCFFALFFFFFKFEWQSQTKSCSLCELFIRNLSEQYYMEVCFLRFFHE